MWFCNSDIKHCLQCVYNVLVDLNLGGFKSKNQRS